MISSLFQVGARRIAAAAATSQLQQQQQHRTIIQAIQNNSALRQLPIGNAPKRIRSTMAPLLQQLTNQMLWSKQQQQVNETMMRSFMTASSRVVATHLPENVADDTSSIQLSSTSRSIISLNLECGALDEDDDGYVVKLRKNSFEKLL